MPREIIQARLSAEQRRKQLIEVAIDLFSRKGFAGTTTREIAAAAGVTEAIVFRHFASKQDFYSAILQHISAEDRLDNWLEEAQRLMDATDDEGLIRLVITRLVESIRREPRFERLMILAALEGNELAELRMRHFLIPIGKRLAEYIVERQAQGALAPGDPYAILITMAGSANYFALQRFIYGSYELGSYDLNCAEGPSAGWPSKGRPSNAPLQHQSDPEAMVEDITRFVMHGLLTSTPPRKARKK